MTGSQLVYLIIFNGVLAIATIVLAAATVYLSLTTRGMVKQARKSSQGTIILQANKDFFFDDRLYKVRKAIESKDKVLVSNGGKCTDQDVEDYIGYLETLYSFIDAGILDLEIVDDSFGAYAQEAYSNKEIHEYIMTLRRENANDELYGGLEKWAKS